MSTEQPRILLVDDDDLNLDVLLECLKDDPYELIQAKDGVQALDLLRHDPKRFDAMVLDRMMPGMNGLEVMSTLKADDDGKWDTGGYADFCRVATRNMRGHGGGRLFLPDETI